METLTKKHVYTVTELTRNIRVALEDTFGTVWVEGEVSNFKAHQSGHMYFSIRDRESVLSSVLFRRIASGIKFEIKSGMQVLCFGKISVYDKRGQYQLYVEQIEPKGIGSLQLFCNLASSGNPVYFDAVPEPTSIALLGLGAVGLSFLRRRR